jgi:hypothetical protein
MIALLSLAALISAFLIASALNLTSAGISNERQDRSMSALRKAKAALIAYAASEQWQLYKGQPADQPGGLPCPDTDDDGASEGLCPTALNRVGRLPWASIGADDLRDASGERLWYAVSSNFRRLSGTTIINSDTQGLLTVTGDAPASNVVAIVFAPGEALSGQDRIVQHNLPAAYLEGFTAASPDYTFNSVATPSNTANDRLLVITQADLMAVVEPVVAARIERDVKPLLQDYFGKWGAYPFAVQFASPPVAQGAYLGTSSPQTRMGLLPVTNTAAFTWQNATVTQIPGGTGSSTVTSSSCSVSLPPPPQTVTCTVNYSGTGSNNDRPNIRLEVFLPNANVAFADTPSSAPVPYDMINFLMVKGGGGPPPAANPPPYGWWSNFASFVPTLTFVAQAAGGTLTYTGTLQNSDQMNGQATITFSLPAPGYLPRLTNPSSTNPNIAWFLSNQWYRQTYYAVSPGFAPGGVPYGNPAACSPLPATPSCLTVNNLPAPKDNKSAILVFAGRALDGQIHPSSNPKNYLEGENCNLTAGKDLDIGSSPSTCNLTTSDYVYEHRAGTPTTINDRVVVVSP